RPRAHRRAAADPARRAVGRAVAEAGGRRVPPARAGARQRRQHPAGGAERARGACHRRPRLRAGGRARAAVRPARRAGGQSGGRRALPRRRAGGGGGLMPLVQVLADGLVVGSMIALGAVGLTLVYAILRFANFAHGELIAWGGYFALSLLTLATGWLGLEAGGIGGLSIGWALLAALAGAMVLTAALGIGLDALLFRSLRRRGGAITLIIASFGAALALRNLIAFLYGPTPTYYSRAIPMALPLLPEEVAAVTGQIRMTPDQLFILGLTAVLVVAL